MTIFTLGVGKYAVSQSHNAAGRPSLTIRRIQPQPVGSILEPQSLCVEDFDLILDVQTPEAAGVLLAVAQAIAFAHGVKH